MNGITVSIGDQVYAREGEAPIGAVRAVRPHELVVGIENFGDVTVPAPAVRAVHDGKVVVDVTRLPTDVQRAARHAHDRETE